MQVKEAFGKWMPVDRAIFSMVVEQIPSPLKSMPVKVDQLARDFAENTPIYKEAKQAVIECSTKDPLVIFVAKM